MKYKNIIFDCDSTLTKIEGLDEIARQKGILDQVEAITRKGMNGEIPYEVSFRRRWLEIVRPTKEDLEWLGQYYIRNLVEGAFEAVTKLKELARHVSILSHVPEPSIRILAEHLGIAQENVFAVPTKFIYDSTMEVSEEFLGEIDSFKERVVKEIRVTGPTVLIGDGVTDLKAARIADLFIGFGGVVFRPKLKKLCRFYIEEPSLQPILDIVL